MLSILVLQFLSLNSDPSIEKVQHRRAYMNSCLPYFAHWTFSRRPAADHPYTWLSKVFSKLISRTRASKSRPALSLCKSGYYKIDDAASDSRLS